MSRVVGLVRGIAKWVLIVLLGLVLLLALVIGALLAALRSDTGTTWVLDQVPGLQRSGDSGSLLGEWRAETVKWKGYGIDLTLTDPYIDWSPMCLLKKTLCLETLTAERIDLEMAGSEPGDESESGPFELPSVSIPLSLDIRNVDLGPFNYNGTPVWNRLLLAGGGGGADFHVQRLQVVRDDLELEARGRIETRGDWPLAIDLGLQLTPPYGDTWEISGQLRGSLRDLRADLVSEGYLDAVAEARLSPLNPDLPARIELNSNRFLALDTLPPTLALENWTLSARGNLSTGYRIETRARLPAEGNSIDLDLKGRVATSGAEQLSLVLTGPSLEGEGNAELTAEGSVDWTDELVARADLRMGAFPWYTLLPDMEPPPVVISSLVVNGEYRDGSYQATVDMDASGPMGDSTLDTQVTGDLEQVQLTDLSMTTGAGQLTGNADIGFADQIRWRAELSLEDFDPGFWVPQASASINGSVFSEGHLDSQGRPQFAARWDLDGEWQEAPLQSRGEVNAEGDRWLIPGISARIGENQLDASGELRDPLAEGGEMDVEATLSVTEPGVLSPGLSGTIDGTVSLSGPFLDPAGELDLTVNSLAWQDQLTVERVKLTADLSRGQSLDAALELEQMQVAGQVLERLDADLTGTRSDHRLELSARHPEAVLTTVFTGGWDPDQTSWLGELAQGEVELIGPEQLWQLADPASIRFEGGDTLTVGEHCWRWDDSSICAGEQTLLPDTSLDLELARFPAATLAPLLPETLRWEAMINADLAVTLTDQGPQGRVNVQAGPGEVSVVMEEDWETLGYEVLNLTLNLAPELASLALQLTGEGLGDVSVDVELDPLAEDRPMAGNFSLSGFDLALVGGLLNMEEVSGGIEGSGTLEGPLMNPLVNGEIRLENGRIIDPMLPTAVEDLSLVLSLQGRRATLDGDWSSNGSGRGEIGGALDWEGAPLLTLILSGENLPVTYEPYARLEVSPDIELRFADGELSLSGEVNVPRGAIEVRELPEQAVSVSNDEVIVGAEEEDSAVRAVNMNIQVNVGSDEVTFEGFGVTGDLEGGLRIGNEMDTRGTLQLVDGRYRAFGQELELRRARLVFVGAIGEPYIDVEAVRRVDNVVAGIRLSGPASEPQAEVFSEPPMSQNEALSYVVLGRPLQSQGDQGQMSRAALSLGLKQASGLTRGIGEAFGIQDLTLEAEGSGEESAVVASGYLTDDLSIRYGVGLFEPITTVALRYDLGRYFYVEAASGLASSLDIFYTRDF